MRIKIRAPRRAVVGVAATATLFAGLLVPDASTSAAAATAHQPRRDEAPIARGGPVDRADGRAEWDKALKQWEASRSNGQTALAEQVAKSKRDKAAQAALRSGQKAGVDQVVGAQLAADTDPGPGGTMGRPGGGDYKATSLAPSSTWTAGGSSGSFTWSHPLRVVPAAAGPVPQLSIAYDSGSVDGRTAVTNNQTSPLGEGFDITNSYVERNYGSCHQDGHEKKHDLCWRGEHLTLVLNGQANPLVRVSDTEFKLKSDDGSIIRRLQGAANGAKYGEHWQLTTTDGTKYTFGLNRLPGWETGKAETDSTLVVPVYTDDASDPDNPFSRPAAEACHGATFADSLCTQGWRWNLDLVTDLDGNAASYWYQKEQNFYAKGGEETNPVEYDRGSYLKRIEYGQRSDNLYSAGPQQVRFLTEERCLAADCSSLTAATQAKWPDVPFDSLCSADQIRNADTTYPFEDPKCANVPAPTFFTRRLLSQVTTGLWTGTEFREVDRWTMQHSWFDPGDVGDTTDQVLWLSSIQHSGRVGEPITTRPTRLAWESDAMSNRVDKTGDGMAPLNRPRLSTIISETGAITQVGYAPAECTAGTHPVTPNGGDSVKAAAENTKRCFPTYWAPYGGDPKIDWFHKYVVSSVREKDTTTADTVTTSYEYEGGAAWRYDEDATVADDYRTWSQWRGYGKVSTLVGDAAAPDRSKTTAAYFRGMDGDLAASKSSRVAAKVAGLTEAAPEVADSDEFAGMAYESVLYSGVTRTGDTGAPVSSTVNRPWSKQTASMSHAASRLDLPGTEDDKDISAVTVRAVAVRPDKIVKQIRVTSEATPYWKQAIQEVAGRTTDVGLPTSVDSWTVERPSASPTDRTCTRLSYAANAARGLSGLLWRNQTVAVPCSNATPVLSTDTNVPGDIISDNLVRYEGGGTAWAGQTPLSTHVIATGRAKSYTTSRTTNIQVMSTTTYDALGRPKVATDAAGAKTTTNYMPADAGIPQSVEVINDLQHKTVTQLEPAWMVPTIVTDANNRRVETTYDALGRATAIWTPLGHRPFGAEPDYKFTYHLGGADEVGDPVDDSWVRTSRYTGDGDYYIDTYETFDALLRPRQTQRPAVGPGRILTDTRYDDRGQAYMTFADAFDPDHEPSGVRWMVEEGNAVQTDTTFDGANRPVAVKTTYLLAVEQNGTTLKSRTTTTTYRGNETVVHPPNGGIGTLVQTDALGRVVERRQYPTESPTGDVHEDTVFKYDRHGRQSEIIGPASTTAKWTYNYDLRGRQISATDPDRGQTVTTYDEFDRVLSTDAKGLGGSVTNKRLSYTYDKLGRKTGMFSGLDPATGTKLADWKYDTVAKGYVGSSTRVSAGRSYTKSVLDYGPLYQPKKSSITLSETDPLVTEANLPKTFTFETDYQRDGSVYSTTQPAAGGLPQEIIQFKYDDERLGLVDEIFSGATSAVVTNTSYSPFGDLSAVDLANSRSSLVKAQMLYEYDGLRRMTRYDVVAETHEKHITDQFYAYNDADQITSITDRADSSTVIEGSGRDNLCFTYDAYQRLKEAWTPHPDSTIVSSEPNVDPVADCSSTHKASDKLGGPGAYRHTYAYKKGGARASWTQHATTADGTDSVTTYAYDGTCPGSDRGPHTLAYVQVDGVKRAACNDPTGNITASHTEDGTPRATTWNSEGKLSSAKVGEEGAPGSVYYAHLYDADGNLFIKRPAGYKDGKTTIYLGSTEIELIKTGTATTPKYEISARRYYSHPAGTVAVRTAKQGVSGNQLTFMAADPHGTSNATIRASTMEAKKRFTDPFGNSRGGVDTWVDDKGFLGKPYDDVTGLTHIGAREYDAQTGRFLSLDPLMDTADGQSLNGFTYSNSDPVNKTDPTGLILLDSPGGGSPAYVPPPAPTPDPPERSWRDQISGEVLLGAAAEVAGGVDGVANMLAADAKRKVPGLEHVKLESNLEGGVTYVAEKAGYDTTGVLSPFTGGRVASYFIPGVGIFKALTSGPRLLPRVGNAMKMLGTLMRKGSDEAGDGARRRASGTYRGESQRAPGGHDGPEVSLDKVKRCLGQCGMSVRDYDLVHERVITTPAGAPAYGNSPHTYHGQPYRGPRGRPLIQISDMGLRSLEEAVTTIFHEVFHHKNFALRGVGGSEAEAEEYGLKMLEEFLRRRR
ncbi:RHS repeat-associated core domain-containing protein [Nocardioides speluncae]|uniref:RHS repeat-associated core domain-containing protein n=1 Tax=Nocardioides speluncae TaxID=2670337 RepID=UPI000D6965DE|nr:RHS repeat-associated core domain-containing protein [Nocardioides speluncae]